MRGTAYFGGGGGSGPPGPSSAGAVAMPLDLPEGSNGLDWPIFAISSSNLLNSSGVPGVTVSDALNSLQAGNLSPRTVTGNFNFSTSAAPDSGGPNRSDVGTLVLVNSVGAVAGTVNSGLFNIGDVLLMMIIGAFPGEASFVAGAGETILSNGLSNKTFGQNCLIAMMQISLHNWVVIGNVALL